MAVNDTGILSARPPSPPRILFVDAYDSFSENVVALLRCLLKADVSTIRIDDTKIKTSQSGGGGGGDSSLDSYDAIVIGPGPGTPDSAADTGRLEEIWDVATEHRIPVLGVCLGFQSLCSRYGLAVNRLDMPCHGHTKRICHRNRDILKDVGEVVATNYNSLGVRVKMPMSMDLSFSSPSPSSSSSASSSISSPSEAADSHSMSSSSNGAMSPADHTYHMPVRDLELLAICEDGYMMAVKHVCLPFWGLQFHPESCLSNTACHQVLVNWWAKVQKNNGTFRRLQDQTQASRVSCAVSSTKPESIESSATEIGRVLEKVLQSCTEQVSFRCLNIKISTAEMARLGQLLCNDDDTVVRLESSKRGQFSIYALPHSDSWLLEQVGNTCQIYRQGGKVEFSHDATSPRATLTAVEDVFSANLVSSGGAAEVPFWGGLIGYLSYEAGLDLTMPRHQQPKATYCARTVPDISLAWVDRSLVHGKETGRVWVQSLRRNDDTWIDEMVVKLQEFTATPAITAADQTPLVPPSISAVTLPDHNSYISGIRSCQSQLHAGNSYELCLTTEATIKSTTAADKLYASLQAVNPALYSAYLRLGQTTILSCSPEQFLSWSRSSPYLDMTPMKGTIAKGPEMTRERARELLGTPKEEAENLMIVDLIRHDLHRSLGSQDGGRINSVVQVKSLYELVETENTYQLISHIRGHVPVGLLPKDEKQEQTRKIMQSGHKTLRTALPPGSMTGAPKIRSCSILAGLEQRHRGVYSGVIGYFDIGGSACWSVAIRCAFSHDSEDEPPPDDGEEDGKVKTWHVGAGGAITVLSDEEQEWEEMRVKMGGVLRGFNLTFANDK